MPLFTTLYHKVTSNTRVNVAKYVTKDYNITHTRNGDTGMKITGHRGAAFEYPENTIGGFLKAYDAGIRCFELDLQWSNGDIYVMHDNSLLRTCGEKKSIGNVNWNTEIPNAAHNSHIPFEPIPQLSQLLPLFEKCNHIELEIKSHKDESDYRKICASLNDMMAACDLAKYYITSGHDEPLQVAAEMCRFIKRGFIYKDLMDHTDHEVPPREHYSDIIVCDWDYTDIDTVKMVKNAMKSRKVHTPIAIHGINDFRIMQQMQNLDVDYLITDIPMEALKKFRG